MYRGPITYPMHNQRVQLGINTVVRVMFGNFAKIGRAAGASPTKHLAGLAKAQSCQSFNQNLVLLFVFSFSSFVKASQKFF